VHNVMLFVAIHSNMTSFIGYMNNTMIKPTIHFNLHMRIDEQIIARDKIFMKIMLPMLKLDTNSGFHELFLN
jgi:hypothetical protein